MIYTIIHYHRKHTHTSDSKCVSNCSTKFQNKHFTETSRLNNSSLIYRGALPCRKSIRLQWRNRKKRLHVYCGYFWRHAYLIKLRVESLFLHCRLVLGLFPHIWLQDSVKERKTEAKVTLKSDHYSPVQHRG